MFFQPPAEMVVKEVCGLTGDAGETHLEATKLLDEISVVDPDDPTRRTRDVDKAIELYMKQHPSVEPQVTSPTHWSVPMHSVWIVAVGQNQEGSHSNRQWWCPGRADCLENESKQED